MAIAAGGRSQLGCTTHRMVERSGFEPPTSSVRGRRSPRLSYRPTDGASIPVVSIPSVASAKVPVRASQGVVLLRSTPGLGEGWRWRAEASAVSAGTW
jgi:hypothetical protein